MCLIIDANVICKVFPPISHPDFAPVLDALLKKRAVAVYGGELAREYMRVGSLMRLLVELDRQGILRKESDDEVDSMASDIEKKAVCVSNDVHIIALACVSRVRLLCSHDKRLHADFTNPDILQPKGSVYQKPSHKHLISRHCRPLHED